MENVLKTLELERPDCLVCLNGVLPERDTLFLLQTYSIPFIAADGAANKLKALDFTPEYIVGDLDSLHQEHDEGFSHWQQQGVSIVHIDDQNSTDFEKCLEFVLARHLRNVLVCGLHGGDLDHTLNNWSIVMRYGRRMNLAIYDAGKIGVPLYEDFKGVRITTSQGAMVSLIPQPKAVLTTHGLQWDLSNESLELGVREGARNRAVREQVHLYLHHGSLFVVMEASLPTMPRVC